MTNVSIVRMFEKSYAAENIISDGYRKSIRSAISSLRKYLRFREMKARKKAAEKGESREQRVDFTPTLADLTKKTLEGLANRTVKRGRSRPTANRITRTLLVLARYAKDKRLIDRVPRVRRLKEPPLIPTAFTVAEIQLRLDAIKSRFGNTRWGRLLHLSLNIAYDTALRSIDCVQIQMKDLNLQTGEAWVTEQKTQYRRGFMLHSDTLAELKAWWEFNGRTPLPNENILLYTYKTATPLRNRIKEAWGLAGLPHGRRELFQKVRRTTINLGLRAGIDPSQIAGHSSRAVTRKHYLVADMAPPMDIAAHIPRPQSA